jgi:hypothetical protein
VGGDVSVGRDDGVGTGKLLASGDFVAVESTCVASGVGTPIGVGIPTVPETAGDLGGGAEDDTTLGDGCGDPQPTTKISKDAIRARPTA